MNLDGILLVDKPVGWTSFDVVAKVRGTIRRGTGKKFKVGHTGTLDPLATGLLVVVVGSYCKRAAEFSKLDKTYETEMKLGENSTTGDEEGVKTHVSDLKPSEEAVQAILKKFTGEIMQVPPAHSAVKVGGKRAYKLARQGKEFTIEPRKVRVSSLKLEKYDYPLIKFIADVGSGTYIRSLAQDLGQELETGAYITGLRRTKVGEFRIKDAGIDLENLKTEGVYSSLKTI